MLGVRSSPRIAKRKTSLNVGQPSPKDKLNRTVALKSGIDNFQSTISNRKKDTERMIIENDLVILSKHFYRTFRCRIVGRSVERFKLHQFLLESSNESLYGNILFIGGNPGTGKTALVSEVCRDLFGSSWVYHNAMEDSGRIPQVDKNTHKVLVIDEIDAFTDPLVTMQSVDKNIKVIGIANTVDLAIESGILSLGFPCYTVDDTIAIINDRIRLAKEERSSLLPIDPVIVELVARKSASIGDLRRSLDLFKSTILQAINLNEPSISLKHALTACQSIQQNQPVNTLLSKLSLHQKIIITSFFSITRTRKAATLEQIFEEYRRICRESRISEAVLKADYLDLIASLEADSIILIKKRINQMIEWGNSVNVAQESMKEAYREELLKIPVLCDYIQ
jgi:Cdc6-like AAA superfamily ATPase